MSPAGRIALLYSVFAALATAVNLAAQALSMLAYSGPHAVAVSILLGTAAGLPVKYVLEKRHIFGFATDNLAHDGVLFALYTASGVLTTLIFWGVEWAFHLAFEGDLARYAGGVLGLAIGYVIKYRLDKRFVFVGGKNASRGTACS